MKKRTATSILLAGSGLLVILLGWEYYSLRMHTEKVRALQDRYYGYIDVVQRIVRTQKTQGAAVISEGEPAIDRSSAYLKESALSYLKEQQLDEFLIQSDDEGGAGRSSMGAKPGGQLEIAYTSDEEAIPQWAQTPRRDSETGIVFACPLDRSRFWLSSLFGSRKKPNGQIGFHQGIDMAACRGTEVHAAAAGLVEYAGYAPGYGNTIVIVHDVVYKTRYAHLDEIKVSKNQKIEQGGMIGAVGDTGFTIKRGSDASHLHFELYERGKQVNPLALISL